VKFYDIRSTKKASNEISYNFEKLLNIFEKGKFSVVFSNSASEIFDKFYLMIKLSDNSKITALLQFIEAYAEIEKVFIYEEEKNLIPNRWILPANTPNEKKLLIKFFNSKEKILVSFLLGKITKSGKSRGKLCENGVKNLKLILEKNEKDHRVKERDSTTSNKNFNIEEANDTTNKLIEKNNSKKEINFNFLQNGFYKNFEIFSPIGNNTTSDLNPSTHQGPSGSCSSKINLSSYSNNLLSSVNSLSSSINSSLPVGMRLNFQSNSSNQVGITYVQAQKQIINSNPLTPITPLAMAALGSSGSFLSSELNLKFDPKTTQNLGKKISVENVEKIDFLVENKENSNRAANHILSQKSKTGKENSNFQPSSKKRGGKNLENYKILYDQDYSGIKKRNTPDEERKKYIISVPNIINGKDLRTTVMIKNIPSYVSQVDLLKIINKNYSKAYNFFYLPIDFNKKQNAGYAFINFKTSKLIVNFFMEFENQPWNFPNCGNKICYLSYARIQGFRSICEHFEKSNIMKQIDEKVKPIIILD
jgi:hypothetical protein